MMAWFENDAGCSQWYEERGEGAPIVLLHGWCKTSAVWQFQFDALSEWFRVIAPDLSGYGRSERTAASYGLTDFSADVAALFNQLDLKDALLVGWSQGGQIALQAFHALRDRLSGLALVSTTPRFTASADYPYGLSEAEAEGMSIKVHRNLSRALNGFNAHMFAAGELENCPHQVQIRELLSSAPLPETEVAILGLNALYQADMRPLLSGVDLPALIISGDCDRICLPEASAYMAREIRNSSRLVFSGCGHAPFLTRPETFNNSISDFHRRNLGFV